MYAAFFRLAREPFSIAPDPRFLYLSDAHREALAHLLYGVTAGGAGGGFVLLTGEIGAGKTTVCRCFLEQVPAHCDVAYVFNPQLGALELLRTVCDEFGVPRREGASTIKDHVDALNAFLLEGHAAGRRRVLVIDEAQSLAPEVLEQLRLLTNLETHTAKLLQIVLIGQPELRELLARPELEQLEQRVVARWHLPALSAGETAAYLQHRLAVAGLEGPMPFEPRAVVRLHQLGRGVPRRINLLADRALLGAWTAGQPQVTREIVERAAAEVLGRPPKAPAAARRWRGALVGGVAGAAAALAGVALWTAGGLPGAGDRASAAAPAGAASMARARPGPAASAPASPASEAAAGRQPGPGADRPIANPEAAPDAADAPRVLAAAWRSEDPAWQQLAARWDQALPATEPCTAAARAGLACHRGEAGVPLLRTLDRPLLLVLRPAQDAPAWVLATGLTADGVQLAARDGSPPLAVPWTVLGPLWRGEYATLWRPPPGWSAVAPAGASAETLPEPLRGWLAAQLPGDAAQPLPARLLAFQIAQGLKPDGLVGPLTLMSLQHARGGAAGEPRLAAR